MNRPIEQYDQDLMRGTIIVDPNGLEREFLAFDEDGDLIVSAPDLNGKSGEVVFHASDCSLNT